MKKLIHVLYITTILISTGAFAQAEGCYYTLPPGAGPLFHHDLSDLLFGTRNNTQVTLTGNLAFNQNNQKNNCTVKDLVTQIGQVSKEACLNNDTYYTSINVEKCDCNGKCEVRYEIRESNDYWPDDIVDINRGTFNIKG